MEVLALTAATNALACRMSELLVVLVTFPDLEKARSIGKRLVENRLAACVNLIPAIESIYTWQGAVEQSNEVLAIFKTTSANWADFEAALQQAHPYEVPEIVAIKPEAVSALYERWVADSVA
jgi:periplasmic divalent cation tolerance protein